MSTQSAPSTYILRKAWQLGRKMARKERRLQPDLAGAHEFPTYALFAQSHRYRLEQRPGYQLWDERLQALIEREGNGQGVPLDNPRVWDAFYTRIGAPIRDVFWAAWEDAYQLKAGYVQAIRAAAQSRLAHSAPLRVCHPDAVPADGDEFERWEQIANRLAGDIDLNTLDVRRVLPPS